MIFDSIESVLKKNQPDDSQLDSFKNALAKCKYAKHLNPKLYSLRVELGIDGKKNGSSSGCLDKPSTDFEFEKNLDNDITKSYLFE